MKQALKLTRQDFVSDNEVRWCPGCGDYAILATMQRTLPMMNIAKEDVAFISGIGCSSRFPYYLDCFGFHTIHGRAPTIATGLKLARPDLHVFIVTGDGDGLSIGSNHLLHLIRKNINVTVLLFNNRIYGLTKGQYSPTSETGKKTKSSPRGSLEQGVCPTQFALSAGATFVARSIDVDAKGLQDILLQAVAHQGTSFIEIYQNCNVFNDGAFAQEAERATRAQNTLALRPGEPMRFGQEGEHKVVRTANGLSVSDDPSADALLHETNHDDGLLLELAKWRLPESPCVTGIFRQVEAPTFETAHHQRKTSLEDLQSVLSRGEAWKIGS